MSKCWYCNNELTSGDSPKHFGICNKCYDEMFKSSDTIISSFTNKISDLEAKLAYIEESARAVIDANFKIAEERDKLKQQLSEKERQYETLYKLFSEQHEIIDQNELGCFEEVNRLLKEQKDFYIVEKTEYDKMKQGAKDIVKELKQQLDITKKSLELLKYQPNYYMFVNENTETIDVDLAISKAKEMLENE